MVPIFSYAVLHNSGNFHDWLGGSFARNAVSEDLHTDQYTREIIWIFFTLKPCRTDRNRPFMHLRLLFVLPSNAAANLYFICDPVTKVRLSFPSIQKFIINSHKQQIKV